MSFPNNYQQMTKKERARWLLDQKFTATLDIDPVKLEPAFVPYVAGKRFGQQFFETQREAIDFAKVVLYSALIEK